MNISGLFLALRSIALVIGLQNVCGPSTFLWYWHNRLLDFDLTCTKYASICENLAVMKNLG